MRHERIGERLVALAVGGLGVLIVAQTSSIEGGAGFSGVGPRAFPLAVGVPLVVLSLLLARESFGGGFRDLEDAPAGRGDWTHFFVIGAGILVHMAIIGSIGFIVASALLFTACAYGFGSRRVSRDLGIGFVLSLVTWLVFARGLSINLPAGPFSFLAP